MTFLIRLLVNAAALWVATRIVPGVTYTGEFLPFLAVALVFGVVNTLIGPVVKLLSLPLIILTLGLFALVVNAGLLGITAALSDRLTISGFWTAMFAALIIAIVSAILNRALVPRKDRD